MTDADGQFVASEELREELASINKWLDGQKYTAADGTPEYVREREGKLARSFEYYVMNEKAPVPQVTGACATLTGCIFLLIFEAAQLFFVSPVQPEQFRQIEKRIPHITVNRKRYSQQCRFIIVCSGPQKEILYFRTGGEKLLYQPVSQIKAGRELV